MTRGTGSSSLVEKKWDESFDGGNAIPGTSPSRRTPPKGPSWGFSDEEAEYAWGDEEVGRSHVQDITYAVLSLSYACSPVSITALANPVGVLDHGP